jgi:hypothetical protein
MALPSSGQISIDEIQIELQVSEGSLSQLGIYAGLISYQGQQIAMTDFYGYSNCPAYGTYVGAFCSGCAYYYIYADGYCSTYNQLVNPSDPSCGPNCGGGYLCQPPWSYECSIYPNPCYYYGYYDCLQPY